MGAELEAILVDGAATTRRPRHGPTRPPGSPCANCGAVLQGAWCHDCGQLAEDFHRSIWRLMMEAVEGITHLDGRFWTTAPALFLHPGKLTRDYIEGHRASQIPPLRLFLVVLLLVFFIGSVTGGKAEFFRMNGAEDSAARSQTEAQIDRINVDPGDHSQSANNWLRPRLKAVLRDPERFKLVLEGQSERFAFLTLPLATLLLSLLFVFQRRFFIFDHTIFALHSLSFQGLLFSVSALAGTLWDPLSSLLLIGAPVHLFVHMRGVYRTGIAGTLLRMTLLGVGSGIGFVILLLLLVFVGLSAMG
jgi:hypothetical protein